MLRAIGFQINGYEPPLSFIAFAVVTNDGQTFSGLLAEETATSLKLKAAEGVETSLLRSEVEAVDTH